MTDFFNDHNFLSYYSLKLKGLNPNYCLYLSKCLLNYNLQDFNFIISSVLLTSASRHHSKIQSIDGVVFLK